jgi:hypothetical protein
LLQDRIAIEIRAMSKAVPLRVDALSTHHNRWGYRGVEQVRGKFRAVLGNKAWRSAYFATAVEAAEAYDREARRRYGARAFFNFPHPGSSERRVEPMDDDVCRQGHERKLHTYYRPNGRPAYCRACNKLAQARSAARQKART